ncbi:hypothetical protein BDQ12DRAFT_735743 [Crucibulum laeve]|uniref:Short-chain dehydrogenase/reductase SDR n=1 Tax=Crucibulum laeve TaxID=68775 RepID=A0A5C3M1E3_9AGAR|nr:hypothetical protein BDQ12DRAFT_735743 [Crucibulum laeve]
MSGQNAFNLQGKVAVITGAASGIGLETSKLFLRSGIQGLVLVDRSKEALKKAFSESSESDSQLCEFVEADVSNEDSTKLYVKTAVDRWGRLDICVLNAGILFLGIKHAGRAMKDNPEGSSGSIVVISSQLGLEGAPGLSAYSASKWAVRGLALTAAEELTPLGIRVNSVCPGPIHTPLLDAFEKESWPVMAGKTLMNRLGKPEEIANAVLYLASGASSFCSGTTLKVDGGYSKFG